MNIKNRVQVLLKEILKKSKMTNTELAKEIGIGRNTLYEWLRAKRNIKGKPYVDKVELIAKKHKVKIKAEGNE